MAVGQICKVVKNKNFTVMSNYHLRDKDLSLKAKGLLSVVLSLPEDWDYSVAGLVAIVAEKTTTVKTCLKELQKQGYLEIKKELPSKSNGGRMQYTYIFYEKSQLLNHKTQNTRYEKQEVEFLDVEFLEIENQLQLNTNKRNTNKQNTEKQNINREKKKYVQIFTKPTVKEIEDYCKEKGYNIDAQYFFDYYESVNWRNKNGPIKSWKQTLVTWNKNQAKWEQEKNKGSTKGGKNELDFLSFLR